MRRILSQWTRDTGGVSTRGIINCLYVAHKNITPAGAHRGFLFICNFCGSELQQFDQQQVELQPLTLSRSPPSPPCIAEATWPQCKCEGFFFFSVSSRGAARSKIRCHRRCTVTAGLLQGSAGRQRPAAGQQRVGTAETQQTSHQCRESKPIRLGKKSQITV